MDDHCKYKILLKKYMSWLLDVEGSTLLDRTAYSGVQELSSAEMEALREIENQLIGEKF
jgi:hypothetical protein